MNIPVSHDAPQPPPEKGAAALGGSIFQTSVTAALLGLGTLTLYEPSLRHGFINYDDPYYVTANLHVLRGLSWANLGWALRTITYGNWHPLSWLAHMAEVQVFGLNPAGFHFASMLVHAINVMLVFLLLQAATGWRWRSAAVAALLAVHPLNVEAVAWVAEFKSLLCATFLLLALWAYREYTRQPGVGRYLAVAALFALGLMAKPMVVTLPVLLLCLDYWPLRRMPVPGEAEFSGAFWKLAGEKVPLLLLSAGSAAITLFAQRDIGALGSRLALPLHLRLENAVYSYLAYIVKGVWPARLAVFYPHPENSLALWKVGAAAIVLAAITVLVWRQRGRRYLLAGWCWYLVALLPVIGIVQVGRQAMADRYAYIPFLGLFALAVWLAAEVLPRKLPRALPLAATVLIVCAYGWAANRQLSYWQNSYSLWAHALAAAPDNSIAEDNVGTALVAMGRPQEAMAHFEAAARLGPRDFEPRYNRGTLLQRAGQFVPAEREYRLAIANAVDPVDAAHAHNNLGVLYLQTNRPGAALREFDSAIRLDPNQHNSLLARGTLEYQAGKLDSALADIARAAQIAPSPIAYFWLGQALEAKGELEPAARAYQSVLRMAPGMAEAQARLNAVRLRLRK